MKSDKNTLILYHGSRIKRYGQHMVWEMTNMITEKDFI